MREPHRVHPKLVSGKRRDRGHYRASIVVVVVIDFGKLLDAKIADAYHSVVPESGASDYVRRTTRTEYLAFRTGQTRANRQDSSTRTTYPTVVLPPPRSEYAFTIVALLAIFVIHPIIS